MTGPSFGLAARRPAPVRAYNEAGESIEEPTGEQVDAMIAALDQDCSFLIVERIGPDADQRYIQTQLDADLAYVVEYRDGDAEHHFVVVLPPGSMSEVTAVIRHWIADDGAWRTALAWERLTFDG
jgi:hypothetical protein